MVNLYRIIPQGECKSCFRTIRGIMRYADMSVIYIAPVGEVDEAILKRIIPCLEERFLFTFSVLPCLSVPDRAFNSAKKKYLASLICDSIKSSLPDDARYTLGITSVDTFEDSSNFIYNVSSAEDSVGLVSIHRLAHSGVKDSLEHDLVFQRILKETTHELGHLLGFRHCFNNSCVMYFSYSINDTDKKEAFFCQECEKKLNMIQNL